LIFFTISVSSEAIVLLAFKAIISSSLIMDFPSSRYSFKNSLTLGITSFQSVSTVLVSVIKLLAIKTPFTKETQKVP
jgi:hypothetical protein